MKISFQGLSVAKGLTMKCVANRQVFVELMSGALKWHLPHVSMCTWLQQVTIIFLKSFYHLFIFTIGEEKKSMYIQGG